MPRHGSPGLQESLLRTSSLSDSVSELSESFRRSASEFVDTVAKLEDRLADSEDSPQTGAVTQTSRCRRRCPTREGCIVWGLIGVLAIVSIYFTVTGDVQRLLNAVRNLGFSGGVVLVLVYAICMVILVPGTILNVGAGFLYGTFWGYVVTIFGCMLGAVLCFALGRGVLQGWVRDKVAEHGPVARLCELMGTSSQMSKRETLTVVLVSRLPPVMPFALTNYAFSITDVSFPVYFGGTLFGVTPACLLDAYIGSLCDSLSEVLGGGDPDSDDNSASGAALGTAKQVELVVGVVLTIFATTVLVVYGNRVYVRLQWQAERDGDRRWSLDSRPQEQSLIGDNRAHQAGESSMMSRPASPTGALYLHTHPPDLLATSQAFPPQAFPPPGAAIAAAAPATPAENTSDPPVEHGKE